MQLPAQFDYLLIPGFVGTGRLFRPLIDTGAFARPPTICPHTDATQSIADMATTICATPRDWSRTVVIAESMGGLIAAEIAARPSSTPHALVFAGTFARSPQRALIRLSRLVPLPLVYWLRTTRFGIRLAATGLTAKAELVDLVQSVNRELSATAWRQRIDLIHTTDVRAALARITAPACYLRALNDRLVPKAASEHFCAQLREITCIDVPGPHLLLQVAPERCLRAIAEFLDGARSRGGQELRLL